MIGCGSSFILLLICAVLVRFNALERSPANISCVDLKINLKNNKMDIEIIKAELDLLKGELQVTETAHKNLTNLLDMLDKQLMLGGVSKSFAVGENVKVDRCIHGHEFELGQVVTIVEYEPSQTTSWLCSDGRNQWWLSEDEVNVC